MSSTPHSQYTMNEYLRVKTAWKGVPQRRRKRSESPQIGSSPFTSGREPHKLSNVLGVVSEDMGWETELHRAQILAEWPSFVGACLAEHTQVLGISHSVLQIQCDSTSWATELRRLRAEMMTRLINEYPQAQLRDIRFFAPGAPSWRHGFRTVRGRGPRDTYG